ncbi:MAG TPA: hypothetical protein VK586_16860 [Streptosporangiaceae bacterium]|nr:hypothetical protein [Streptosporangiaceae bacterium]
MTISQQHPDGPAARLAELAGQLGASLTTWAARDDTRPQPGVRQAANTAIDAMDAMLAELHRARQQLVGEMRESDDAAMERSARLLAAGRTRRRVCAHADLDGAGMHLLEPGEACPRAGQQPGGAR